MTVKASAPFDTGFRMIDGSVLNAAFAFFGSSENSIVAVGTTQATAWLLRAAINVLGTVAANTGVKLPPPTPGLVVTVFNDGASTVKVYGNTTDTIDGTAGATGVSLSAAARCQYFCTDTTKWESALLGAVSA